MQNVMGDVHAYPKLWEEVAADGSVDSSDSNGSGDGDDNGYNFKSCTNTPSIKMPLHIAPETEESFHWARSVRKTQLSSSGLLVSTMGYDDEQSHVQCVLGIVERTIVISQEFALSTLFLAAHRCLVCRTSTSNDYLLANDEKITLCAPCISDNRMLITIHTFTGTLIAIVISTFIARRQNREWTRQKNVDRLHNRSIDALLIAGILRFLSSVLRTLTASYSSDTVSALAIGGMGLHVLTADYNYANGISDKAKLLYEGGNVDKFRPLFLGGTVSINCVFFSAALLASRLPSDRDYSYLFFMWTVVIFAYYPEARYLIAHLRHPYRAICSGTIMIGSALSALFLLDVGLERNIFLFIQCFLLVVAPLWKAVIRKKKETISGPWDIAHVSVEE